jgi:hypothetical protein
MRSKPVNPRRTKLGARGYIVTAVIARESSEAIVFRRFFDPGSPPSREARGGKEG